MPGKSLKNYLEFYAVLLRNNGEGVRKNEFRITNILTVISHML